MRARVGHALIAAVIAGAIVAPAGASGHPGVHAAGVKHCHKWAPYPNILISSARNMSCKRAAREMRHYEGSISREFWTQHDYRCYRVSGSSLGGQWRCVKEKRAFRFEFGD